MLPRSKLGNAPTTTVCATKGYVVAGDEQGGITLFQSAPDSGSWSQTQRAQEQKTSCCTSMLILQERGQHGRCCFVWYSSQRYSDKMQDTNFDHLKMEGKVNFVQRLLCFSFVSRFQYGMYSPLLATDDGLLVRDRSSHSLDNSDPSNQRRIRLGGRGRIPPSVDAGKQQRS